MTVRQHEHYQVTETEAAVYSDLKLILKFLRLCYMLLHPHNDQALQPVCKLGSDACKGAIYKKVSVEEKLRSCVASNYLYHVCLIMVLS